MTDPSIQSTRVDPRRYHEAAPADVGAHNPRPPVCLYLETTNGCNLLCTTCPENLCGIGTSCRF